MIKRFRSAVRALIPSRNGGQAPVQEAQDATQESLPIKANNGPGLLAHPHYTFNDRQLIIGGANCIPYGDLIDNNFTDGIYSLDLTIAWPTSAPAWTKLARPRLDVFSTIGGVSLNKEGSILYHFDMHHKVQAYNLRTAEWSSPLSMSKNFGSFPSIALDSDNDLIFGVVHRGRFGFSKLTAYDPTTNAVSVVSEADPGQAWGLRLYSSARKSLFFLWTEGPTTLNEYNIADDSWSQVVGTGDIPSPRFNACFVSAYGGTKLVVVGGKQIVDQEGIPGPIWRENQVLSDVYMFDVETSVWTKETSTPVGYSAAGCAVSGDHLILFGGFSLSYDTLSENHGSEYDANGDTPSIYNMRTRTWVSDYIPS